MGGGLFVNDFDRTHLGILAECLLIINQPVFLYQWKASGPTVFLTDSPASEVTRASGY